jgi:hypothetical protein
MDIEVENFFPSNHQTIKATFDIFIKDWNIKIRKLKLLETKGEKWISFPSLQVKKEDGTKYWLPLISAEGDFKKDLQKRILNALESFISILDDPRSNYQK